MGREFDSMLEALRVKCTGSEDPGNGGTSKDVQDRREQLAQVHLSAKKRAGGRRRPASGRGSSQGSRVYAVELFDLDQQRGTAHAYLSYGSGALF